MGFILITMRFTHDGNYAREYKTLPGTFPDQQ